MTPPYSLEQAKYLCGLYQRLVGTYFDSSLKVEDVLIVPFDLASKQRFMLYYMVMAQDAQDVVLGEYKGFLFDIMLILRNQTGEIVHRELASFLKSDTTADSVEGYNGHSSASNVVSFSDSLS